MNLINGNFYLNKEAKAVRVQIESDGDFHIYDVTGKSIQTIPQKTMYSTQDKKGKTIQQEANTHVNGWTPISRNAFEHAKKANAEKSKLPKRKKA